MMTAILRFKRVNIPFPCRLGVISDTHSTSLPDGMDREFALYFKGVDSILHMGDVTHPAVLNDIEALGYRIITVQGNNDRMLQHPHVILLGCGPYSVGMVHGSGGGYDFVEPRALRIIRSVTDQPLDAVLYGHTHVPRDHIRDSIRFLNPGSLCFPRLDPSGTFGPSPSLATLEISDKGFDFQIFTL
ncbi:metallophosphatase family protein [Myxococcota bacterium]|nr:metallophosphatase family protein [Myxococcota bacterium]MBU1537371.1 metallophosphatase family protein [Myxococcota bacterium]